MSDEVMQVQTKTIKIRPLDLDAPGFMPRYKRLLEAKRMFTDTQKALPEDVDGALDLLLEHVVEPANRFEARAALEGASGKDIGELINVLIGANTVPPASGAA